MEDGRTTEGGQVRFGFKESVFPGFSWRGYAIYSRLQVWKIFPKIVTDIDVYNEKKYLPVLRSRMCNITELFSNKLFRKKFCLPAFLIKNKATDTNLNKNFHIKLLLQTANKIIKMLIISSFRMRWLLMLTSTGPVCIELFSDMWIQTVTQSKLTSRWPLSQAPTSSSLVLLYLNQPRNHSLSQCLVVL